MQQSFLDDNLIACRDRGQTQQLQRSDSTASYSSESFATARSRTVASSCSFHIRQRRLSAGSPCPALNSSDESCVFPNSEEDAVFHRGRSRSSHVFRTSPKSALRRHLSCGPFPNTRSQKIGEENAQTESTPGSAPSNRDGWSGLLHASDQAEAAEGRDANGAGLFLNSLSTDFPQHAEELTPPEKRVENEGRVSSLASLNYDEMKQVACPRLRAVEVANDDPLFGRGGGLFPDSESSGKAPSSIGLGEVLSSIVGIIGEHSRAVVRNGIGFLLLNAKEILTAIAILTILLLSVIGVLLATLVTSYYVVSFYTTSPPIHTFPVYFDYCPSVSQEIRQQIRKAFSQTCQSRGVEGVSSQVESSSVPVGSGWRVGFTSASDLCVGSMAVATIPFSNRTWEFTLTDAEMFSFRPDLFSHAAFRASQEASSDVAEERMRLSGKFESAPKWLELEEAPSRVPLQGLVDIRLFLSTGFEEDSFGNAFSHSPPMAALLLHDRENALLASSSRALDMRGNARGILLETFFPRSLLRQSGWTRSRQSVVFMQDVPHALLRRLHFARVLVYPKVRVQHAELSLIAKPHGLLHNFLVQNPLPAYIVLAVVAVACALASLVSCCCCGAFFCFFACVFPVLQVARLPLHAVQKVLDQVAICAKGVELLFLGGATEDWTEWKVRSQPPTSTSEPGPSFTPR